MDPPYLTVFCCFSVLAWGFELYLSLRQRARLLQNEDPHPLIELTKEEYKASRRYSLEKNAFNILSEAVNTFASITFFLMNGMHWLWEVSKVITKFAGLSENEIAVSLVFVFIFYLKGTIEGIPWELYEVFVIEETHGFNKQSLGLWIRDQAVTHLLVIVIGGPVLACSLYIMIWTGPNFYLYLWAFTTVVVFFMISIYPHAIAPLFNTFTLLESGSLKTAIDALAARNGFPLKEVYVVDGSLRSSHSNAYFYGFGRNKRIVLYDTLSPALHRQAHPEADEKEAAAEAREAAAAGEAAAASGCSDEEIVAILGHELGHWRLRHTMLQLAVAEAHLLVFFAAFGAMTRAPGMYRSFGFASETPVMVGLLVFGCVASPVEHLVAFAQNCLTRHFEYQADGFAAAQGLGSLLQQGLRKISRDNKSNPDPDPWYSAYHHTHPSLLERLRALSPADKPKQS